MAGSGGQASRNDRPAGEARGGNLSPDGSWVAYPAGPGIGQSDIWVLELARGLSRQVHLQQRHLHRDGRPTGSIFITTTQAESTRKRRMGLARRSC
jgi:hypothetical protein